MYLIFKHLAGATLLLFAFSCGSNQTKNSIETEVDPIAKSAILEKGLELSASKCFSCHSPSADQDSRLAPPFASIKRHYIDENTSLADFTEDLIDFVKEPTEETAKMPGAVEKFALMPKLSFPEDELKIIAQYIFEGDLETPVWFQKHQDSEVVSIPTDTTLKAKGLKLAMSTKKVLGKNLMGAINAHGSEYAVEFCNLKGVSLIDSMAIELDAKIKRVSDRPRNSHAQANSRESEIIMNFKEPLAQGKDIIPVVDEATMKATGYYPILTNQMCLQCHGVKTNDIEAKTLNKIEKLYPKDKATGYDINELRGIWVVEMKK